MPAKRPTQPTPQHKPSISSYLRRSRLVRFGLLWLAPSLLLVSLFFSEILKPINSIQSFPDRMLLPTLILLATALLIALIIYFTPRPRGFAAKLVAALFMSWLMVGYDSHLIQFATIIRGLVPILPAPDQDLPIISPVFLAFLTALAVFIGICFERLQKKFSQLDTKTSVIAVFVVAGFMFLSQATALVRILPAIAEQSRVTASLQKPANAQPDKLLPDIYYFVFDRYTNDDVLKQQLGFDNSQFSEFLVKNGFHINPDAYSNYPYTNMSIASTLNADYLDQAVAPYKNQQVQSHTLFYNLNMQSSVIKALKDAGYSYHSVGSTYTATNKAPLADIDNLSDITISLFGKVIKQVRDLENSTVQQSVFFRFMHDLSWSPLKITQTDEVGFMREQLSTVEQLASEKPGGRFVFVHMLMPHPPYLLNADGSTNAFPQPDSLGKPIQQKYLQQVQFANSRIKELVQKIRKNSNDQAVIILNSDEGPYPQPMHDTFMNPSTSASIIGAETFVGDMRNWSKDWLRMKFGIQQAVHIPKATRADLANLSSVNVFRIVLNRYLGYDLDYLPQCSYGLPQGRHMQYNFTDVTQKITGASKEFCQQHQSQP